MKLSIIIPIYNVELYIESCLLSVLNQSNLDDTEIILIDDCGTDNSMNIVEKIVKENPDHTNISILRHTQNQGLSAARNTGIKYAKGEYVFFLDSDDELPENTINIFNRYLKQFGNADFYIGNYIVDGPFNASILNNSKIEYNNNDDIFNAYINNEWYAMACGKFINRDYFISNNLWFPIKRLHEDEYFSFLLALKARKMVIIPDYVYIYKIRENSITTLKKKKNYIDYSWIINRNFSNLRKHNKPVSSIVYNYITRILLQHILSILSSHLKYKEKLILLSWSKKELSLFQQRKYTIKSFVKTLIINTPSALIYIFLLPFYFKRMNN